MQRVGEVSAVEELRPARPRELGAAEALWTATFGDNGAFQRRFYALAGLEGPLVLTEEGRVRSILALPEVTLTFWDGQSVRAGYVYALATHPSARGKGCASRLLDCAAGLLRERGCACVLTVPARPELFDFFGRNGFVPGFYHREWTAQPGEARGEAVTPEDYGALRETLLAGTTHVTHPTGLLAYQQQMCPAPGSGLYRLELSHGVGCAAVECWEGGPVVKELLCPPEDEGEAAGAAAALCGGPARVRLPGEGGRPFGAIRWLQETVPAPWENAPAGWFGPGFD